MAYEFYVTIEGSKSGIIKGDVVRRGHEGKIAALAFDYEVMLEQSRRGSGQAAGKRQHSPVTITKRWDVATPRLFQVLVTGEALKSVLIEFEGTDRKTGKKLNLSHRQIDQRLHYGHFPVCGCGHRRIGRCVVCLSEDRNREQNRQDRSGGRCDEVTLLTRAARLKPNTRCTS